MKNIKIYTPILVSLITCAIVGSSLAGYEMPDFKIEARTPAAVTAQTVSPVKLIERPEIAKTSPKGSTQIGKEEEDKDVTYKDGVYYGSATGFGGKIKVKVTIKNGKIASISIVSHNETGSYLSRARAVIGSIIKKQSTNVDAVSGATYSSAGIVKAVRNALSKAKVKKNKNDGKKNKKKKDKDKDKNKDKTADESVQNFPYPDGVYQGSAFGFSGVVTVEVELAGGRIKDIRIISHSDDQTFFDRARAVINSIINNQTSKVDAVSGATRSSAGIIGAVEDALEKAKQKANENAGEAGGNSNDDPNNGGGTQPQDQKYTDGSYSGTALCIDDAGNFDAYNLSLVISLAGDKIEGLKEVNTDDDGSNQAYIDYAVGELSKKLKGRAIKDGKPDGVDAVSGATFTSRAILNACTEAIKKAEKSN
ncbi:MAG: FMN-binding protein [Mogibacterium sp.]|nr:FMN-binding protein [Mogibacterium sp.]